MTASGPPAYPSGPPAYPGQGQGGAPGYPPTGYPPPGYGAGAMPGTEANSLAVWSLVLALVGFFVTGLLTSIPAIIVGIRARKAAAEGRANNPGMAKAGIVIGWIVTVINLLAVVAFVWLISTLGWDGLLELVEENATWPNRR